MFDVNGIEDFYDKNAMVTYELNGHEIPVHLKQKYTPQTKSLFPEYNRDNTATAGAMTKSPPPESYQSNTGINCLTPLQCSAATNDNSAEGKATVAQQTKGDKNLLAIRNFLQLHSNQYGENHGHISLPQKELESNQEKSNSKEFLENDVKLPWKSSVSSAHVDLNDYNKGPKSNELFSKFSNTLSSNHDTMTGDTKSIKYDESRNELLDKFKNALSTNRYTMTGEPKRPRFGERETELFNKFSSNANTDNDNRVPSNGASGNHNEVTDLNRAESHRTHEESSLNQQPFPSSKLSEFAKLHTGSISNLPPLDEIHGLENSRDDLIKQFGHDNSLLSSRESEVANLLKKIPNQMLDSRDSGNNLEASKLNENFNRETPQNSITNDFHSPSNDFGQQNDLDLSHGLSGLLNMKINNFIKPPTDRNGQLQPIDSTSALDKPSTSMAPSTMEVAENTNNNPNVVDDPEKGKAKIRILSLLGELTDKLKGVEAVVSAQHNAEHNHEENSVMSKLQSPEKSESSLTTESPNEILHHTFSDSNSNSYKPLSMVSKFESLNGKELVSSQNTLENDDSRHALKEPDTKGFWSSHDLLHPDLPQHDHDSLRSEPQLSTHDFPHNDLHEDASHRPSHDNDLNSPPTVSGTTAQQPADISPDNPSSKSSHDSMESNAPSEETHNFGSTIHGEYHGKIPEVDLKEAHKDLFSSINERKPDENTEHHAEFSSKPTDELSKPVDDSSSRPSGPPPITEVERFIEKEKEKEKQKAVMEKLKEQEKLLPDQIQKLRDQDKPFIMNTDSIDYHKEDEAEPDKNFANITPDFKPYGDEDDSERGRITKYRHKLSAYLQDNLNKKLDGHNPETNRPNSELKLDSDKEFEHHHEDSIEKNFVEDKKIIDKVKEDGDKGFTLPLKNKDTDGKSYHHLDESKFSEDKSLDLNEKAKGSDGKYSHMDKERASNDMDYGSSERNKEPLDEKTFHQKDRSKDFNERDFSKSDREREYDKEYLHSDKDKTLSDEHYPHSDKSKDSSDSRDLDYSKTDKDYNKETDSQAYQHKKKDNAELVKPKYHDDKEYPFSHEQKEPDIREHGKSSKDKEDAERDYYHSSKHRSEEYESHSHRTKDEEEKGNSHLSSDRIPLDKETSHLDKDYLNSDKDDKEKLFDKEPRDSHRMHDKEADERSERGGIKESSRLNELEDFDKSSKDKDIKISYKDHEIDDKYKRKHESDDNDNYITGKPNEHETAEHSKSRSETKDDSKSLLLESLGTGDGDGPSKPSHGDIHEDTRSINPTPSDDYLTNGGKREHEEHSESTASKDKSEAPSEGDKIKSKPPSDASSNHQPGKDRERTLTPKSKYIGIFFCDNDFVMSKV